MNLKTGLIIGGSLTVVIGAIYVVPKVIPSIKINSIGSSLINGNKMYGFKGYIAGSKVDFEGKQDVDGGG